MPLADQIARPATVADECNLVASGATTCSTVVVGSAHPSGHGRRGEPGSRNVEGESGHAFSRCKAIAAGAMRADDDWGEWVSNDQHPQAATSSFLASDASQPPGPPLHLYRIDIQALRAFAVVLVLLWHAGLPFLDAGFIGVDIFFVLSGYLITELILRERGKTGTIRLRDFYARRLRRLLPAASAVTIATLVTSLLVMPSLRLQSIAFDGLASTLYVENWRLAHQAVDYQASQVAASPFQHYWSLSVEEQFYLGWPLLLLVLLRGPQGYFRSGGFRSRLLIALVLTFLISFSYSLWDSYASPDRAYFATNNRVWQFAAGGILASAVTLFGQIKRRELAIVLSVAGLSALIAGAMFLDPSAPYPGVGALVPTLGTVAVLAGGASAVATSVGRYLTSRPIVWVGDLSYSLYLWHWPMLVIAAEVLGPLGVTEGLVVVAASFVPSVITERLVERPIRTAPRFASWHAGLALAAVLMFVTAGLAFGLAATAPTLRAADGADNPFFQNSVEGALPDEDAAGPGVATSAPGVSTGTNGTTVPSDSQPVVSALRNLGAETLLDDTGNPLPNPVIEYEFAQIYPAPGTEYLPPAFRCRTAVDSKDIVSDCDVNAGPSSPRLALVGDSHALQWMPIVRDIAVQNGWSLDVYLKAACALNAERSGPTCSAWQSDVQSALLGDPPDFVLLSAGDPLLESASQNNSRSQGFVSAWRPLREAGIQLVVIADSPRPDQDIRECVFDNQSALARCAFDRTKGLQSGTNLRNATQEGDETLDLNDLICPADPCPAVVGQTVVFRDNNHLSNEYVQTLKRPFELRLREIVARTSGS